jgi:hypothetical protein
MLVCMYFSHPRVGERNVASDCASHGQLCQVVEILQMQSVIVGGSRGTGKLPNELMDSV